MLIRRSRLVPCPQATPRLHSEAEFFTPVHGFQADVERDANGAVIGRRLQSASEMQGYAEFAIAAARGVLDHFTEADGVEYTSIFLSGSMFADGDTVGIGMSLFYSKDAPTSVAMTTLTSTQSTLFTNRVDNSSAVTPMVYTSSAAGALQSCFSARSIEDSPWDEENSTISQSTVGLAVVAVDDALSIVLPDEEGGEDWVFIVDTYVLDAVAADYPALTAPSDDDCLALLVPTEDDALPTAIIDDDSGVPADPDAAVEMLLQTAVNHSTVDRRLSSARRLEDVMADGAKILSKETPVTDEEVMAMDGELRASHSRQLYHDWRWRSRTYSDSKEMFHSGAYSSYGAKKWDTCKDHKYKSTCRYYGHTTFYVCENDNAKATFTYKWKGWWSGYLLSLNFAGTDDGGDVLADLDYFKTQSPKTGNWYHSGFYKYQDKLSTCINNMRTALRNHGIELDFITGHSLGGAGATIYAQEHGNALKGVATWGAPKTNIRNSGNQITGWRFFHEDDLVSGNFAAFTGILYIFCPWCAALFSAMNAVQGGCWGGHPLSCYDHKLTNAYEYYDKLVCNHNEAKKAARRKVGYNRCRWWQWGCHISYAARYSAAYLANLCKWRKKRKWAWSTKAYDGWYVLNAGVHTKYGDWEGKGDYSVVRF